jgi:hypothetical protein
MTAETKPTPSTSRRIQQAAGELKGMIAQHYPHASLEMSLGDDPEGVYLTPTVDVPDT